ncbi:hypothetical protein [Streptomyces acidiscabies]|uniref:Uncharacterized protein n=1 Tax=Streptomyces acidiscabies TaxID=42234 RepID=A0ABU4LXW9_9ACTN|nr:hypothetical protein [Streptomyces acidiscabies]MDX3020109.1 hypothetical protein [Streptomyces acidiscabies]
MLPPSGPRHGHAAEDFDDWFVTPNSYEVAYAADGTVAGLSFDMPVPMMTKPVRAAAQPASPRNGPRFSARPSTSNRQTTMSDTTCNHVIAHWVTEDDRQQITGAIAYARNVGDLEALPLLIARLTGSCEARDTYRAQKEERS